MKSHFKGIRYTACGGEIFPSVWSTCMGCTYPECDITEFLGLHLRNTIIPCMPACTYGVYTLENHSTPITCTRALDSKISMGHRTGTSYCNFIIWWHCTLPFCCSQCGWFYSWTHCGHIGTRLWNFMCGVLYYWLVHILCPQESSQGILRQCTMDSKNKDSQSKSRPSTLSTYLIFVIIIIILYYH